MRTNNCFFIGMLWIAASSSALAAARTWDGGAGDSNWFNAVNWDGDASIPQDGESVVISNSAQVRLTNATAWLDTFEMTNATLTFSDTTNLEAALRATNVYIRNLGIVTHATNSATTTNAAGGWDVDARIYILCSNCTIDAGGKIDLDGKGWQATASAGLGPGGGGGRQGGGYGGRGGYQSSSESADGYDRWAWAGLTYGTFNAPSQPGSGGGPYGTPGGKGGGYVRIDAGGTVRVDGAISANGTDGYGGGSGGGVCITCNTFGGSGIIRADGGNAVDIYGGGGGGGRIAVSYSNAPGATVRFTANFGARGIPYGRDGQLGTVYLSDAGFFPVANETLPGGGRLIIGGAGFTNWSPNSLTITNGGIQFPDGFALNVIGGLTVQNGGKLYLTKSSSLTCGGTIMVGTQGVLSVSDNSAVSCGQDLTVTNGGTLFLLGGATNATTAYGVLVSVTGTVYVATNSNIYPWSQMTNGGSAFFDVGNLIVNAGGAINADGKGFPCNINGSGLGPGGGTPGRGAGGYGGAGGNGNTGLGGSAYGSSNAPMNPGSAGGDAYGSQPWGGYGGGLVRVRSANRIQVDGTISADGWSSYPDGGGGSGGGIYLTCKRFGGSGLIRARGGNGEPVYGGSGGGGRIAIWRQTDNWTGTSIDTNSVAFGPVKGTEPACTYGTVGTVVLGVIPPPGTIFTFR